MSTLEQISALTREQVRDFHEQGYLVMRGVIGTSELQALRNSLQEVMALARPGTADFSFASGPKDGRPVLRRIDYILEKAVPTRALLAHPSVLRAVEQLVGADFFPGQDAVVLKMPEQGVAVPWHRDLASTDDYPNDPPVFVGDYYIDDATLSTCLWVIPGSHRWPDPRAHAAIRALNAGGFSKEGAIPVEMKAGDVLFHNVRTLHGSPSNESAQLRRVIYFTFHTARIVAEHGPHRREYIDLKQRVLAASLRQRAQAPYAQTEDAYLYRPPAPFDQAPRDPAPLSTFRYVRDQYLRA